MFTDFFEMAGIVLWAIIILLMIAGGMSIIARPLLGIVKHFQLGQLEVQVAQYQAQVAQADVALVRPDLVNGLLPVPRARLLEMTPAILQVHHEFHSAKRNVPNSLHWSDHRPAMLPAPVEDVDPPMASIPERDIWQLWTAGLLPDNGFLMGHDLETGEPVLADWLQLYSALVGGMSGSGKSTLIRSVLIQSALQGGRFVVLDRHFGAGEESLGASLQPLRPLMLCDVAANESQMVDALHWVLDIGRRRKSGQDSDKSPLILVVDETTAMFQRSNVANELGTVLGEIAQETRKVGLYALCIGQNFSGNIMPTTIRNSFASFISCRARRDVARVMSGDNEFGKMAAGLRTGQAVWMNTNGDTTRLAVPNATQKHIELVARQCLTGEGTQSDFSFPHEEMTPELGVIGKDTGKSLEPSYALDSRALRVVQLFEEGRPQKEILVEVWGASTGRKYMDASNEFQNIIREYIKQLRGNNGR